MRASKFPRSGSPPRTASQVSNECLLSASRDLSGALAELSRMKGTGSPTRRVEVAEMVAVGSPRPTLQDSIQRRRNHTSNAQQRTTSPRRIRSRSHTPGRIRTPRRGSSKPAWRPAGISPSPPRKLRRAVSPVNRFSEVAQPGGVMVSGELVHWCVRRFEALHSEIDTTFGSTHLRSSESAELFRRRKVLEAQEETLLHLASTLLPHPQEAIVRRTEGRPGSVIAAPMHVVGL